MYIYIYTYSYYIYIYTYVFQRGCSRIRLLHSTLLGTSSMDPDDIDSEDAQDGRFCGSDGTWMKVCGRVL